MATRKWRFTYGYGTTGTLAQGPTDFWVEYKQSGEPGKLGIVLHQNWQYAKSDIAANATDGLIIRTAVERRLKELQLVVGRSGILDIDYDQGDGRPEQFTNVVLDSVNPSCADHNRLFEYDASFSWPTAGQLVTVWSAHEVNDVALATLNYRGAWVTATFYAAGDMVAFGGSLWVAKQGNWSQAPANNAIWGVRVAAGAEPTTTFILAPRTRPDTTAFKPVFRNAPVRLRCARGLETIRLTGIRQNISGTGPSSRRTAALAACARWIDKIGAEFLLTVDGNSYGLCHLSDAQPGRLDLPDAVTFELTFFRGYVNG